MNHFQQSEINERQLLQNLFNNFFSKRDCKHFIPTAEKSFAPFDALLLSGNNRTVIIEQKIRTISSKEYETGLIELQKLQTLMQFYKANHSVFYSMSYNDGITIIWKLDKLFQFLKDFDYPIEQFCTNIPMNETSADPLKKRLKTVLKLKLSKADYFISKDFQLISREEFIQ
jgi:hypothetical protein